MPLLRNASNPKEPGVSPAVPRGVGVEEEVEADPVAGTPVRYLGDGVVLRHNTRVSSHRIVSYCEYNLDEMPN